MTNPYPLAAFTDPAAPIPPAPEPTREELLAQLAQLTAQVQAQGPAVADTDASAAVSSPATDASVSVPVSSVPAPPVGTLVHQMHTPPGQDQAVERFGFVVAVDNTAEDKTAAVQWFLSPPTTVRSDAITGVE